MKASRTDRYDPQIEATVYFCMIQALANAGAYASGSTITARVYAEEHHLGFSLVDDGPGVDPARLQAGADIHDMRDRVEAIGGEFNATSVLGTGTAISGRVPTQSLAVASLQ